MIKGESALQRDIQQYLAGIGAYVVKQHGNQYAKLGVPDLLFCHHGQFYAVECKVSPAFRVDPQQQRQLQRIYDAGGVAFYAFRVNDVMVMLDEPFTAQRYASRRQLETVNARYRNLHPDTSV